MKHWKWNWDSPFLSEQWSARRQICKLVCHLVSCQASRFLWTGTQVRQIWHFLASKSSTCLHSRTRTYENSLLASDFIAAWLSSSSLSSYWNRIWLSVLLLISNLYAFPNPIHLPADSNSDFYKRHIKPKSPSYIASYRAKNWFNKGNV